MSHYTTELRYICENYAGLIESVGYKSINEILTKARSKIFSFDYPIFDESYRAPLETKILKHYYTQEIGLETVGLWLLKLDTKLNEIMPYYNQLYKSATIEFNPLYNVDYTIDYSKKGSESGEDKRGITKTGNTNTETSENVSGKTNNMINGKTTAEITTETSQIDKYADTPQGALTGVLTGEYLTNARDIEGKEKQINNTTNEGTSDTTNKEDRTIDEQGNYNESTNDNLTHMANTTEEYIQRVTGKQGGNTYSKDIMEYRETLINIDMMIINELDDLFMKIW